MCDLILQIRLQASRGFTPRSYGSYPVARSTRIKNAPPAEANRLGFEPVPRIMCDLILQIRLQASRGFTPRSYGSDPVARSTRIKNVPPAAAKGHINVNVSRSHFAFVRYFVVKIVVLRELRVSA